MNAAPTTSFSLTAINRKRGISGLPPRPQESPPMAGPRLPDVPVQPETAPAEPAPASIKLPFNPQPADCTPPSSA